LCFQRTAEAHLNLVGGDGALRKLLQELHEVLLGALGIADELGGDSGQEGKIGGGVHGGNLQSSIMRQAGLKDCMKFKKNRTEASCCLVLHVL
jgi:hypothetical protein